MLAGIKTFLKNNPKWRTIFFVSFVLLFYWTRTRPADLIHDLQIRSNYAIMAMGKTGVALVDLTDPSNPTEIAIYNTYGIAQAVDVADEWIYVADGPDGLKIISMADLRSTGVLTQTASIRNNLDQALDVAVKGNNAFVAARDDGVIVYKTEQQGKKLTEVHRHAIDGRTEHIVIAGQRAFVANNDNELFIFDISAPTSFKEEGKFQVPADINDYLVENDKIYIATQQNGLIILDISNPGDIQEIIEIPNVKEAQDVALRGNLAYVASGNDGFFVLDLVDLSSGSAKTSIIGEDKSSNANQIGVINEFVFVADGRNGLRSYESPLKFEFENQNTASGKGAFLATEIKGDYAYIAASEAGVRVINIADKTAPVGLVFNDPVGGHATGVDIHNDFLYVSYRSEGLREYNIAENPEKPALTKTEIPISGEANDVVVGGQYAYVAAGSSGLQIADLANSENAPKIYSLDTSGNAYSVFVLDDWAYVADGESGLQVISIEDPKNPTLRKTINTPGEAVSTFVAKQTNASGSNRLYAFVADGANGLFIIDLTDLDNPVEVATYDTNAYVNDVLVQEKSVFLAERDQGLLILDVSTINAPKLIGSQNTPGQANGLFLQDGEFTYIADGERGLRIVDVKDQSKPEEIGFFDVPKKVDALVIQNPYGYMVDGDKGLWVLDLEEPRTPRPIGNYTTPGQAKNLALMGSKAYIADGTAGLQILDIGNPQKPTLAGTYKEIQNAKAVVVQSDLAYVISEDQRLHILNVTAPDKIEQASVFRTQNIPIDLGISKNYVYIIGRETGLEIVDIENKQKPESVKYDGNLGLPDPRAILTLPDLNLIFIADWLNGVKAFNIEDPDTPQLVFSDPLEGAKAVDLISDGNFIFVVAQEQGVYVFEIYNRSHILRAGEYVAKESEPAYKPYSVAVIAESNDKSRRYITYVPADIEGLQVIEANGNAQITQKGLYESPGEATIMQVIKAIPDIIEAIILRDPSQVQAKIWLRLWYFLYGTVLFFALSGFWLILLAQFVLPVQNINDIYKVIRRLNASIWGHHGPVVYVKEGEIIEGKNIKGEKETERSGRGVARVDLSSAIVLEKRALLEPRYRRLNNSIVQRETRRGRLVPRARIEGPGVVFIEPYEGIHGVADLRPQFRLRPDVQAYTRDGIEVKNPVWILFTLGQPPLVLDVAYEGERKPENLRVIQLKEVDIAARDAIKNLDPQSARIYRRYQVARRFFYKAVEQAEAEIMAEEWVSVSGGMSSPELYLSRLRELAGEWEISDVPQVHQFFVETATEIQATDVKDPQKIEQLKGKIHALADRLLVETLNDFYSKHYQGRKQRGIVVKALTDELDPDDREEIHRFVQKQTLLRYFANLKSQIAQVDYASQGSGGLRAYLEKAFKLAERWGIHTRDEFIQFFQGVASLQTEIDLTRPCEVHWLTHHICILADTYRQPWMAEYYQSLYPELVARYQSALKELMRNTHGLSRFARQTMQDLISQSVAADAQRIFSLNALDFWYQVRPEFENKISRLSDNPENRVELKQYQAALAQFDRITLGLIRTDYPFAESYATVAGLRDCITDARHIAAKLSPRAEWKFPNFLKFVSIRRKIRNIVKQINQLDAMGSLEIVRYADLIELDDFVTYYRQCVSEFRKANANDQNGRSEIGICVANIAQNTQALKQLSNRSFRHPIRQLIRWGEAIHASEPAQVYFFSRRVEDLWKNVQNADQIAIRRYLRKSRQQVEKIQREIRAITLQAQAMNGDSEIRQYQTQLAEMQTALKDCPFPRKLPGLGSDGGERIQVGPFQFLRRRILAAVYSKALDLDQAREPYMPWTDLPVHAAAQTFRDLVAKEQYDHLYEPKDAQKFNMPQLKGNFSFRMRNQGILSFRFIDHIDGDQLKKDIEWLESDLVRYEPRELKSPKILRARGIKVIAAGFPDLFPVSPKVSAHLLEVWRAPWISKAVDIRGQHQLQAVRIINQARAQAQRDMAHTLARILQSSHSEEALAMRVFQALESTAVDADTRQFLPRDTMYMLQSFKQWFLPGGDDQQKSMGDIDFYPFQPDGGSKFGPTTSNGQLSPRRLADENYEEDE